MSTEQNKVNVAAIQELLSWFNYVKERRWLHNDRVVNQKFYGEYGIEVLKSPADEEGSRGRKFVRSYHHKVQIVPPGNVGQFTEVHMADELHIGSLCLLCVYETFSYSDSVPRPGSVWSPQETITNNLQKVIVRNKNGPFEKSYDEKIGSSSGAPAEGEDAQEIEFTLKTAMKQNIWGDIVPYLSVRIGKGISEDQHRHRINKVVKFLTQVAESERIRPIDLITVLPLSVRKSMLAVCGQRLADLAMGINPWKKRRGLMYVAYFGPTKGLQRLSLVEDVLREVASYL